MGADSDRLEASPTAHKGCSDFFYESSYLDNRDVFLARFKEQMEVRHPQIKNMDRDQLWGIGRHYGLITPLLDWTHDPLVAAFFAMVDWCRWVRDPELDEKEEQRRRKTCPYVAVWKLTLVDGLFRGHEFEVVRPTNPDDFAVRIKAQKGTFTKLTSEHLFDVESYLEWRGLLTAIEKLQLSSRTISEGLAWLDDEDIHHASLFPDTHGAAEYANLREYIKPQPVDERKRIMELLNESLRPQSESKP